MNPVPDMSPQNQTNYAVAAYNKRENPTKIYQIIGLSFFSVAMMIVSAIVFSNLITAVAILVCAVTLFLYLLQKPHSIIVNYNDSGILINGEYLPWDKIKTWDMVETDNLTEIYIVTTKLASTYNSFFINKSNFHDYNRFLDYMYQNAEFQAGLAYSNSFQNFLRIVGLK